MDKKDYKVINMEILGTKRIFPFPLHLRCEKTNKECIFLDKNTPLTKSKYKELNEELQHDKSLLVNSSDFAFFGVKKEAEIAPKIDLKSVITDSFYTNNFQALIKFVKEDVEKKTQIETMQMALTVELVKTLLIEDNINNRTAALAYYLCSLDQELDQHAWADILYASLFSNIGQTMANTRSRDHRNKKWQKHANFSLHLMRKTQLPLSDRCKRIIEQHHECYDGSGWPQMRQGAAIEPLALIIHFSSELSEKSYVLTAQEFYDFMTRFRVSLEHKFGPRVSTLVAPVLDAIFAVDGAA